MVKFFELRFEFLMSSLHPLYLIELRENGIATSLSYFLELNQILLKNGCLDLLSLDMA